MLKRVLLWSVILILITAFGMFLALDIPSWTQLDMDKLTNLSQTTVIYDSAGQPAAGMHGGENRRNISIHEVPEHVKNAFVAIEDARFYEHDGVDLKRIGGAVLNNIKAGGYAEGASTITQQLIKLTHLTSEKKLSRKAQEAWLAMQLEQKATKDEILEMYLNVVYFGKGAYGIEAAAQSYFGKSSKELTLGEGALLAGIIKAPGIYAPHINMEKSIERRKIVLSAMLRVGMIDKKTAESASDEAVKLTDNGLPASGGSWYIDWTLMEATDLLGMSLEEILCGGYHIHTSLETNIQNAADLLFENASLFPENAADGTRPESSLIAADPTNGEILCMIGGRSYHARMELNRAMQIKRQPGSVFKPISVYAAAVDYLGYTPLSLLDDTAREYNGYTPSNASGKEYGQVTLRQALARSMNLAAVDLITKTSIDAAASYAVRAGIPLTEDDYNLSLALGSMSKGVSPSELCAAYAPLVNGGYSVQPHTIRRILDAYGNTLYEYDYTGEYVMSAQSARMLTSVLEDAVRFGTARQLAATGFPVAAKTGTVSYNGGGNRDAWTAAYTPNVSVVVWMGYDQPDSDHVLPEGTTGGTYPARLAAAFLTETAAQSNGGSFIAPSGMKSVLIDGKALEINGAAMLASESTPGKYLLEEILPESQLPLLTSDLWEKPQGTDTVYVHASETGQPIISLIASDPHSEYRIIRRIGDTQTEIGIIQGEPGEYISLTDEMLGRKQTAEYCAIARHRLFMEEGIVSESFPSKWVVFNRQGFLQRFIDPADNQDFTKQSPLFE